MPRVVEKSLRTSKCEEFMTDSSASGKTTLFFFIFREFLGRGQLGHKVDLLRRVSTQTQTPCFHTLVFTCCLTNAHALAQVAPSEVPVPFLMVAER